MDLTELNVVAGSFERHPWEQARKVIVERQLNALFAKYSIPKNSIVMDIGSGDAYLVSSLSKAIPSYSFLAYDKYYSASQLTQLREKYHSIPNLKIGQALTDFTLGNITVSTVLLLDVIEHIENDILFLSELRNEKNITKETLFLITVPAFQGLFTSHDTFLGHYRRYTKQMMKEHLAKANFEPIRMRYFFFTPWIGRFIRQTKEKLFSKSDKNDSTGVANWSHGPFVTRFVKAVLLVDYFITSALLATGISLPGLSLMCLARPK